MTDSNKPLGRQAHPKIVRFLLGCVTGNYTDYMVIPSNLRTRIAVWLLDVYLRGRETNHLGWPRVRPLTKTEFQNRLAPAVWIPQDVAEQWISKL